MNSVGDSLRKLGSEGKETLAKGAQRGLGVVEGFSP